MSTLQEGIVCHYKLDDNDADTVVLDSEGYSNGTAQQNTSAMHVDGEIDGALDFNGSTDYIDTNDSFESVFQSDFSISCWYKPVDGIPSHVTEYDVIGCGTSDSSNWVELWHYAYGGKGELGFYYTANGRGVGISAPTTFVNGQETWHHIVGTVKQETATKCRAELYLDGSLFKRSNLSSCVMANYASTQNPYIGLANLAGVSPAGRYCDGSIDDVRIYNQALTATEALILCLHDLELPQSPSTITKTKFYNAGT